MPSGTSFADGRWVRPPASFRSAAGKRATSVVSSSWTKDLSAKAGGASSKVTTKAARQANRCIRDPSAAPAIWKIPTWPHNGATMTVICQLSSRCAGWESRARVHSCVIIQERQGPSQRHIGPLARAIVRTRRAIFRSRRGDAKRALEGEAGHESLRVAGRYPRWNFSNSRCSALMRRTVPVAER